MVQADHYRAHLVRKLEQLAAEAAHQADRVRDGHDYTGHTYAVLKTGVDEARELLDAATLTLLRATDPEAPNSATPPGLHTGYRRSGTNPTRNARRVN